MTVKTSIALLGALLSACSIPKSEETSAAELAAFNEAMYSNLDATYDEVAPSSDPQRQALVSRAQRDVRDLMKDPDATKFKEDFAVLAGNCVTGKVLGKNGFGAYSGYQDYVWTAGVVRLQEAGFKQYSDAFIACMDKQMQEPPPSRS